MLSSLIPWTYKKLKEEKYEKIYSKVILTLFLIGMLNLILIIMAPEVVALIGTEEYKEAVYIIPPIACSCFLMYLFNAFVNVMYYYEQNKLVVVASVTAAVINVVLNWIFISKCGYLAAGYTTLASYICLTVMYGFAYLYTLKKKGICEKVYDVKKWLCLQLAL